MNRKNVCLLLFFSNSFFNQAAAQMDTPTVRFVGEVLVGTEFGKRRDLVCKKWAVRPRLSTFGDGSHHPAIVANVISQINQCLPPAQQLENIGRDNNSANFKLYFSPLDEFEAIAKQNNFVYTKQNWGFYHIIWNSTYEIQQAVVMIAEDKLSGKRLQHYVLEELTQAMGLPGDSNRFQDSVFYEDSSRDEFGSATRLSKLDQKLIRFLYEHVDPGLHAVELGILMTKKWSP